MSADSTQFALRQLASDDLDLVHASKEGDVAAFEQLVKRYDCDFSEFLKLSPAIGKTPKMRPRKHC